MKRIEVPLGDRSYPVLVGSGLLGDPAHWQPYIGGGLVLVVSNDRVAPLYLERVLGALPAQRTHALVLPDGEEHKNLETWARVLDELVRLKAARDACIVTLGGGVIGDLGGYAAASYMRGIAFVQAPTTLLAQVDASVGGKTGVNHEQGKNLIGAFHQPRAVLADTSTLDTLPRREYLSGLAEVAKYGAIRDPALLDWMEASVPSLLEREPSSVQHMVERSVVNKAEIVAADELEAGTRALLNFGHSFGHALETLTGYREFLHGEAVAIGMAVAARLSELRGLLPDGQAGRLTGLLAEMGLPVRVPVQVETKAIWNSLALDKKTLGNRIRLILLERLGSARIDDRSSESEVCAAIDRCRS